MEQIWAEHNEIWVNLLKHSKSSRTDLGRRQKLSRTNVKCEYFIGGRHWGCMAELKSNAMEQQVFIRQTAKEIWSFFGVDFWRRSKASLVWCQVRSVATRWEVGQHISLQPIFENLTNRWVATDGSLRTEICKTRSSEDSPWTITDRDLRFWMVDVTEEEAMTGFIWRWSERFRGRVGSEQREFGVWWVADDVGLGHGILGCKPCGILVWGRCWFF